MPACIRLCVCVSLCACVFVSNKESAWKEYNACLHVCVCMSECVCASVYIYNRFITLKPLDRVSSGYLIYNL